MLMSACLTLVCRRVFPVCVDAVASGLWLRLRRASGLQLADIISIAHSELLAGWTEEAATASMGGQRSQVETPEWDSEDMFTAETNKSVLIKAKADMTPHLQGRHVPAETCVTSGFNVWFVKHKNRYVSDTFFFFPAVKTGTT